MDGTTQTGSVNVPKKAKTKSGPLQDFEPAEANNVTAPPRETCEVHSMRPVPEEMSLRESLGRLTFKGGDPEFAAKRYREIKKLPADWPLEVLVLQDGELKSRSILPLQSVGSA